MATHHTRRTFSIVVIFAATIAIAFGSCTAAWAQTYPQWRDSLPKDKVTLADYRRVTSRWLKWANQFWTGSKALLSIDNNFDFTGTYALALGCLTADPVYDAGAAGISRTEALNRLNKCLASIQNGQTAGYAHARTPGYRAAALLLLNSAPAYSDFLRQQIKNSRNDATVKTDGWVEVSPDESTESDSWPVAAGTVFPAFFQGDAEYQSILNRSREAWMELFATLDMRNNNTVVDGKSVKDWIDGTNINADYTVDNHDVWHIGYTYDSLRLIGIVWASYNKNNHPIPGTFYYNAIPVYEKIQPLNLWDGRVAMPAAKDWPQYEYGETKALHWFAYLKARYSDRVAARMELNILRWMEWKQQLHNGSLSGFSRFSNPPANLLVDEAFNVIIAHFFNVLYPNAVPAATDAELNAACNGEVHAKYAQAYSYRTDHRFASWSKTKSRWQIVPRNGGDHMIEYSFNTPAPRLGSQSNYDNYNLQKFNGGFAVTGQRGTTGAINYVAFVPLPDKKSTLAIITTVYGSDIAGSSSGMEWNMINWIFNGNSRTIHKNNGSINVSGASSSVKQIDSPWINVDNAIGYVNVYSRQTSNLFQYQLSTVNESGYDGQNLTYIRFGWSTSAKPVDHALLAICDATAAQTAQMADGVNARKLDTADLRVRGVWVKGQDGAHYVVVSNFNSGARSVSITLPAQADQTQVITGPAASINGTAYSATIPGMTTSIVRVGETSVEPPPPGRRQIQKFPTQ